MLSECSLCTLNPKASNTEVTGKDPDASVVNIVNRNEKKVGFYQVIFPRLYMFILTLTGCYRNCIQFYRPALVLTLAARALVEERAAEVSPSTAALPVVVHHNLTGGELVTSLSAL